MFRGGATTLDVQRMREKPKVQGRKKRTIVKGKSSSLADDSRIIAVVMLKAFKEEILKSVRIANRKLCVATEPTTPPPVTTSKGLTPANPPVGGLDANDATILNVLENISHYSTPPGSADRVTLIFWPLSEGRSHNVRRDLAPSPRLDAGNNGVSAFSANSKTNEQNEPGGSPSFSLGLTQDQPSPVPVVDDEMGDNGDGDKAETVAEPMPRRTSKRLRLFSGLLEVPGNSPLGQERVKGLAQNNNSTDAALTAALLIQAHALFGVEICRCITPEVITDEAQRAAVMIYEFHEKL
ncbi:unnamed protein product [Brassica oleracea]